MNLSSITTHGLVIRPQRGILYGVEAVGKTAFAIELPRSIIIDTEAGSHQFKCSRITVGNERQLATAINLLLNEPNDYLTIVIDTIDWAEKYLLERICKEKKVNDITDFPHGHGYTLLRDAFDKFLFELNGFIRLGKHVVLIGHAQIKTVQLPGLGEPFDRYELKLDRRNSETLTEWCDFQLFLNWDIRTAKVKDGTVRAVGGRERLIYPLHTAGFDAKNRIGLTDPLKFEYESLAPFFGDIITTPNPATQTAPVPAAEPPQHPIPVSRSVPDPDTEPVEPFLTDQERKAVSAILGSLSQDRLHGFLRKLGKIRPDDDYTALGPTYLRRILANPSGFRDAVTAFKDLEETGDT